MTQTETRELSGWGSFPVQRGKLCEEEDLRAGSAHANLSRGLGRAYGDAALPAAADQLVSSTIRGDRILAFDPANGLLHAEAGVSLRELKELFLRRGWFTPVTPGTQDVTLGGMVAADVHGKNHHVAGTLGRHVVALKIMLASGEVVRCTRESHRDLFLATIGGMGLTGHILEVELRLEHIPTPWIWEERTTFRDLASLIQALRAASREQPFTVSWVDLIGNNPGKCAGILMAGRWAKTEEAPSGALRWKGSRAVPFYFPNWTLNRASIGLFNRFTAFKEKFTSARRVVHPEAFFYPLDQIAHWNRLYGRRGFTQYQCVLPYDDSCGTYHELVKIIRSHRSHCFLCVIKDCGPQEDGLLSFPKPGVSFAMDFPMTPRTQGLIDALNQHVIAQGGRVYLAKDACTRPEDFRRMDDRLPGWFAVKKKYDPGCKLDSALYRRVLAPILARP